MKKISLTLVSIFSIVTIALCQSDGYEKTANNVLYKIVKQGRREKVKIGEFLKFNYTQKLNDSLIRTSYNAIPEYFEVKEPGNASYDPLSVFSLLHKGDSVVIAMSMDSLYKDEGMRPSIFKKGDKLFMMINVVDILADNEAVRTDREIELKQEGDREIALIERKLKEQDINATKTKNGVFVVIHEAGTGLVAGIGSKVAARYTMKLLETDSVIESNIGNGKPVFNFTMGKHQVINGWEEGIKGMKKGTKGTLYIPAVLAYGGMEIEVNKPYANLIFDIQITNVTPPPPKKAVKKKTQNKKTPVVKKTTTTGQQQKK